MKYHHRTFQSYASFVVLVISHRNLVSLLIPFLFLSCFQPESGHYEDPIVVCDFTALYPSLIIAYNVSVVANCESLLVQTDSNDTALLFNMCWPT